MLILVDELYDKILDLVAPEQSIALLSFCVAPNSEQLLSPVSESIRRIRSIRSSIPQCPICAHGSPSLSLPANREAFQWLCNTVRQFQVLVLSSASLASSLWDSAYSKPMSALLTTQCAKSQDLCRVLYSGRLESSAQCILNIVYIFIRTASSVADPAGWVREFVVDRLSAQLHGWEVGLVCESRIRFTVHALPRGRGVSEFLLVPIRARNRTIKQSQL